jgi:transposase
MKKGYPVKLREKVVNYVLNQRKTMKETSKVFEISYETVRNWVKMYREKGTLEVEKKEVKPYKLDWEALRKDVEENPDAYLEERAKKFDVAISTIWNALKKMGIKRRKKSKQYQEQKVEEREKYEERLAQVEQAKRVYLDEFGINQTIAREYGWAERGKKLVAQIKGKREKRINGVAAYRQGKVIAPMLYEGSMTALFFNEYIKTILLPELNPGDVVIMDNANFHKSPLVKKYLAEKNCSLLFLPTYSPDLNPIEHIWAALKSQLRRVRSHFSSLSDSLCYLFSSHPSFS